MAGCSGELEDLASKLAKLLPDSIQVFNLVTLALSGDGIARQVIARDEGGDLDTLAVIVINRIEAPKESISLYCSPLGADNMKDLLIENFDPERETTFAVSKSGTFAENGGTKMLLKGRQPEAKRSNSESWLGYI